MRLRHLWIGRHDNLIDSMIRFDPQPDLYGSTSIRFFVGLNGSGKSNALEVLGLIFSFLAADKMPGLGFDLEYELYGRITRITSEPERLRSEGIDIQEPLPIINLVVLQRKDSDPEQWSSSHVLPKWDPLGYRLLPAKVIGYSTGPTSGLQRALSRAIEQAIHTELEQAITAQPLSWSAPAGTDEISAQVDMLRQGLQRTLDNPTTAFVGSDDALCAVLSLLLHYPDGKVKESRERESYQLLLNRVGLRQKAPLVAFTLHISSSWAGMLTHQRTQSLRDFLKQATLLVPVESSAPETGVSTENQPDFLAVFDCHPSCEYVLEGAPTTPYRLFEELLAWRRQGAVRQIHLAVRRTDTEDLLTINALSDGEFLMLGRYGLLLMLHEVPGEKLILLDEPETHYNDQWKIALIHDITALMELARDATATTDEIIIATHSAITLSDAYHTQVLVFSREKDGVMISQPVNSIFGADISELSARMAEEDYSVGQFAREEVERRIKAALRAHNVSDLENLMNLLGPGLLRSDVARAIRGLKK